MTELLQCNGSLAEELRFYADGRIQELAGSKCLTASSTGNDAPIILTPCDVANPMQVWSLGGN
jgi:Ricin-type beta-trefoil lectin domain